MHGPLNVKQASSYYTNIMFVIGHCVR